MDDRPLPDLIPLGPKEYTRAGEVLGRAFFDDPQWTALIPDPDVRRSKLPEMFTGTAKMTSAARGVVERTPGFETVALWLPPGRDIGPWAMARSGFASALWVVTPPIQDFRRLMVVFGQFDERRKKLMRQPYWYLMAIGVDPLHQGEGFGTGLVRSGIRRADDDGKPIYLETETELSVGFYERFGFEVIDEMTVSQLDLPFSLMIRHPRGPRLPPQEQ